MANYVRLGSVGDEILLSTGIDLTGATVSVDILEPDGTERNVAATAKSPTTSGVISLVTTSSTFVKQGRHEIASRVAFTGPTRTFPGDPVEVVALNRWDLSAS